MRNLPRLLWVTALLLFTNNLALAQASCYFCNSQSGLRVVRYGKESRQVCQECRSKEQSCDLCSRKATLELLEDGRKACAGCLKTRILNQEQLDALYTKVKAFLKKDPTGILVSDPPPVKLANKDEIQTKFTEGGRAMAVAGFYSPYNPEQIYILSGQTAESTEATVVHEYTHAWQTRQCPSQDRALKEGFASWVEYRYLVSIGRPGEAQRLTQKSDPDYGASLVKLLKMEESVGVAGVVNFAKSATRLP